MGSRATHLIALLVAAAIVAVAAPIAQGGNRNHRASVPDPVRAAYTAAWQAYRGQPGGPPANVPDVRRAYTAAWQAYRGLPGGPPAGTRTGYPQAATGLAAAQGLNYANQPTIVSDSQPFSLGTAVADYQRKSQAFSLSTAIVQHQRKSHPPEFAAPTATGHDNGFDWWAAAIGAGIAVGALLLIGGIGAMTIRARQSQAKVRTT